MGKIKDFFKRLQFDFDQIDTANIEKSINFSGENFSGPNVYYLGDNKSQVPITENIYNVIAAQMSLLEVKHYKVEDKKTKVYNLKNSSILRAFGIEVNEKQTNTDFLHTFFYNVVKYGNGIAVIDPFYNGKYNSNLKKKMELKMYNVDISNCEFGNSYVEENGVLYLVIRYKNSGVIDLVPYNLIVHLRYKPQNIHNNELNSYKMDDIVKLYDRALNLKLRDLAGENGDKVVFKIRLDDQADTRIKRVKAQSISEQLTSSKTIVLDGDESIETLKLDKFAYDNEAINDITKNIYNFFGVNENVVKGDYNEQQFSAFYNNTIEPLALRFQEELQRKLIEKDDIIDGERLELAKTRIIATLSQFVQMFDKLVYHGVMSRNDIGKILGLDPVEGGDIYYTNKNAVELGSAESVDSKGGD
jgi:HK97 family phage portal protein